MIQIPDQSPPNSTSGKTTSPIDTPRVRCRRTVDLQPFDNRVADIDIEDYSIIADLQDGTGVGRAVVPTGGIHCQHYAESREIDSDDIVCKVRVIVTSTCAIIVAETVPTAVVSFPRRDGSIVATDREVAANVCSHCNH
jgi:hypothetical protein